MPLFADIRLGRKRLTVTIDLTYYVKVLITAVKSLIVQAWSLGLFIIVKAHLDVRLNKPIWWAKLVSRKENLRFWVLI